jgi:hypothetical protein
MSAIQQVLLAEGGGSSSGVVACLLHFDGTGSSFVDATGKTCTAFGTATQSATQSVFGGKALDLNSGAGRVEVADSTDFDFGTGAFLIEWREYRTANTDYQNPFSRGYNVPGGIFLQSQSPGSNDKNLYFMDGSGVAQNILGVTTGASVLNVWTAWAVQRDSSGVIRVFKNGVQIAFSGGGTYNQLSLGVRAPWVWGADSASSYWVRGYIDEARVQKGVAPYTGSGYTPATSAFTYP